MKQIFATDISESVALLVQRAQIASTSPKDGSIPGFWRGETALRLLQIGKLCADLELTESGEAAKRIQKRLVNQGEDFSNQEFLWKLDGLLKLIESEMGKQLYFIVTNDLAHFVDGDSLFGAEVQAAFPSIDLDLKEAGNCLAFGRNAAAVYHLMRVAEVGLWELGRDRQIPLAQNAKIEFSEWGKIIAELEDAVKAIQQWPNSATKEDAHKFYNHAVIEIRAFNDGWRRHSAHPRPHMPATSPEEAAALWGHVERFMKALAVRVSEGKYTELIWRPI